jgi:hypothetical protein
MINDPVQSVKLLREVHEALRARCAGDAGLWLANCLDAFFASGALSFEEATGLAGDAHSEPWRKREAREIRDGLIAELINRSGLPLAIVSHQIRIYQRGRWQRLDRLSTKMPAAYSGTDRELLFKALTANESVCPSDMPSSTSYLRRVFVSHCVQSTKAVHATSLSVNRKTDEIRRAKG